MTDRWFTDRRLLLSALGLIVTILFQSGLLIFVTSTWIAKMDGRVTNIETSLVGRPALIERLVRTEADSRALRAEVTARLDRIENKLDDLLQRATP